MEIQKIKIFLFLSIFLIAETNAQSISGQVLDAKTNAPIESASVYFDNTTIGTSTNDKGAFEIRIEPGINSPLIISFLGYEKVVIPNYDLSNKFKILLIENDNPLNEVLITYFDGMPKEIKLAHFRAQFLGQSDNAISCKILNEEDLLLRFNKKTKELVVTSKKPIRIRNENLQYEVQFDIIDFVISYRYVDVDREIFRIKSLFYTGTSFYKSLNEVDEKVDSTRKATYQGSVLHFMRALASETLKLERYQIFSNSFLVDPSKYINVRPIKTSDSVRVKLRLPLSILYNNEVQSGMVLTTTHNQPKAIIKQKRSIPKKGDTIRLESLKIPTTKSSNLSYYNTEIIIDGFGNYSPIEAIYFTGYMSNLRIGDTLPLDYNLGN